MRTGLFLILLSCFSAHIVAQDTLTLNYDGQIREYLLYVPDMYENEGLEVPLLVTLHGLNDNMHNFSNRGFFPIADTANFIVVVPQALTDPNPLFTLFGPAWNSGAALFGLNPNSGVDDVGFLMTLVEEVKANYMIDPTRVYFAGESMGGFMTNRLVCERTADITAFATVAGTIGENITCTPSAPIPALHFHGTSDQTVPYAGNPYGMDAEELVMHWVGNNLAETTPVTTSYPDIAQDNYTVDHFHYPNLSNGADVELFKVNGADHIWMSGNNQDISYQLEIWRFLSRYKKGTLDGRNITREEPQITICPNPVNRSLSFKFASEWAGSEVRITDAMGKEVNRHTLNSESLDVGKLPYGIYYVNINGNPGVFFDRFIKE